MGQKDPSRCRAATLGTTGFGGLTLGLAAAAVGISTWGVGLIAFGGGLFAGYGAYGSADACSDDGRGQGQGPGAGGGEGSGGGAGGMGGRGRTLIPVVGAVLFLITVLSFMLAKSFPSHGLVDLNDLGAASLGTLLAVGTVVLTLRR